jgi:NAD(P)-dependent dehydrogenase (short-subunit alcohol dehydrogenase family)
MTIENKSIAITGAERGIGRAIALHLASRRARIVLGARNAAEIEAVADAIGAAGRCGRSPGRISG